MPIKPSYIHHFALLKPPLQFRLQRSPNASLLPKKKHFQINPMPQSFTADLTTAYFSTLRSEIMKTTPTINNRSHIREIDCNIKVKKEIDTDTYRIPDSDISAFKDMPLAIDFLMRSTRLFYSHLTPCLRKESLSPKYELLWHIRHYIIDPQDTFEPIPPHKDLPNDHIMAMYPPNPLNKNVSQHFYFFNTLTNQTTHTYSTDAPILFGPHYHSIHAVPINHSNPMERCVVNIGLKNLELLHDSFLN